MRTLTKKLKTLSAITDEICLSISLPTHRTHPDNQQDLILLKNLIAEAEKNIINRFGKRGSKNMVERLGNILDEINRNYHLDSLHVFVSENTLEIIPLPISIMNSEVIVQQKFDMHYLEELLKRSKEYLILLLSQSGVQLFNTLNDNIISEIQNNDFPFEQNKHYITDADKASDSKQVDKMIQEYFNKVDKAVQNIYNQHKTSVVVVCTARNYQHLMAVSDNSEIYKGNSLINYNDVSISTLANQAWGIINSQFD